MPRRPARVLVPGLLLPLLLAACGSDDGAGTAAAATEGGPSVVVGAYPFQFLAEEVGGSRVEVENLVKPGADPHAVELTPQQVASVAEADLVVHLEGLQPAVDEAVEQNAGAAVLEVGSVVPLEEHNHADEHADEQTDEHDHDLAGDPHVWLDPTRMVTLADALADQLAEADPDGADAYRAAAADLGARLTELDEELQQGLQGCERTTFVTNHEAFGYLADRYGLEQVGISGLSPEAEPSPARIREVQEVIEHEGVTTIFYETTVSPDVAETIAADLGVETAVLDPLESLADPDGKDYLSVMRDNLAALQEANGCT